jgi:hypothetical protein
MKNLRLYSRDISKSIWHVINFRHSSAFAVIIKEFVKNNNNYFFLLEAKYVAPYSNNQSCLVF